MHAGLPTCFLGEDCPKVQNRNAELCSHFSHSVRISFCVFCCPLRSIFSHIVDVSLLALLDRRGRDQDELRVLRDHGRMLNQLDQIFLELGQRYALIVLGLRVTGVIRTEKYNLVNSASFHDGRERWTYQEPYPNLFGRRYDPVHDA